MGGCFGPFTKKFGSGAVNILEARVVLANGSLVVANMVSHPDLYFSIRGGGGGVAGVVTEFTARSHRNPEYTSQASFYATTETLDECTTLFSKSMQMMAALNAPGKGQDCENNGIGWDCDDSGGTISLSCNTYVHIVIVHLQLITLSCKS
jgi:hypothetical protein